METKLIPKAVRFYLHLLGCNIGNDGSLTVKAPMKHGKDLKYDLILVIGDQRLAQQIIPE